MRKRTGDWRDLLSAYALALDAKKVFLGFIAVLVTVVVMAVAAAVYAPLGGGVESVADLEGTALLWRFSYGRGLEMLARFAPLLNPFAGGLMHFVLSVLVYVALFAGWSGFAGGISRLAALEYARDDLPTLEDARTMVRPRRKSYFLAPLMPLAVIVLLTALNAVGGLVASIPYVGRVLLVFPGWPLLVATTVIITFLAVFGVLSFGLMMPAVSVEGKDAFESWSTAYSYVLWGLRRFICYTLIVGVIGLIAAVVAWALGELLIYLIHQSVNIGFVGGTDWIVHRVAADAQGARVELLPAGEGFNLVMSTILVALMLIIRGLPAAYVFSYFFTAYTIVYFLVRKEQDNIEIDEIYEEGVPEEEGPEPMGLAEEAAAVEAEQEAPAGEAQEPEEEPEEPEEEEPAESEEPEGPAESEEPEKEQ
jgi:hypothetical protein